jgi:hypothetical protein
MAEVDRATVNLASRSRIQEVKCACEIFVCTMTRGFFYLGNSPVEWSVRQVGDWLTSIGFAKYAQEFMNEGIDGVTLQSVGEDQLQEFVLTPLHRTQILSARNALFGRPYFIHN